MTGDAQKDDWTDAFDDAGDPASGLRKRHREAVLDPDPDEEHRVTGLSQVNYRVHYEYRPDGGAFEEARRERVEEATTPELLSCSCGLGGMERAEAREHVRIARRRRERG